MPENLHEQIMELRKKGLSAIKIAGQLGIDLSTVYYHISPKYREAQLRAQKRYRERHPEVVLERIKRWFRVNAKEYKRRQRFKYLYNAVHTKYREYRLYMPEKQMYEVLRKSFKISPELLKVILEKPFEEAWEYAKSFKKTYYIRKR